VTVSTRSLQSGGFEFKRREQEERWIVPAEEALAVIRAEIERLEAQNMAH